jgi:hypothetical protein
MDVSYASSFTSASFASDDVSFLDGGAAVMNAFAGTSVGLAPPSPTGTDGTDGTEDTEVDDVHEHAPPREITMVDNNFVAENDIIFESTSSERRVRQRTLYSDLSYIGHHVEVYLDESTTLTPTERADRVRAAWQLFDVAFGHGWLPTELPFSFESGREVRVLSLAKSYSSGALDSMRTVLLRFQRYCGSLHIDCFPCNKTTVSHFLLEVQDADRVKNRANYRGLAAAGVLKALIALSAAVNADFPSGVLASTLVQSSALATDARANKAEFLLPLGFAFHIEEIACADWFETMNPGVPRPPHLFGLSEFVVWTARCLVLATLMSIRATSVMRSKLLRLDTVPSGPLAGRKFFVFQCSGDKAPRSRDICVSEHWCLASGVLPNGVELWADAFTARYAGQDFFLSGVVSKPQNSLGRATAWSGMEANPKAMTEFVRYFLSLSPYLMTPEDCRLYNLSARCMRHLHSSLRAIFDVGVACRDVGHYDLGRWVPPKKAGGRAIGMPSLYAGSKQKLWREMIAHDQVVSAVNTWMGGSPWRSKVPLQRCEFPSFDFLLDQAPASPNDLGVVPEEPPSDGEVADSDDSPLDGEAVDADDYPSDDDGAFFDNFDIDSFTGAVASSFASI